MKAWRVTDRECACGSSTIVFAETRNKAKAIAQYSDSFEGCDLRYVDFRATRAPALDKYYHGNKEMDWFDTNDRIAMVKEAGFVCSYEFERADLECESCPAKQWRERCEEAAE